MTGKTSLILVMGFSIIFLLFGHRFMVMTVNTAENFSDYYVETVLHNIAVTGANIAANKIFQDKNWDDGFSNISFSGGTYSVDVTVIDEYESLIEVECTASFNGETKTIRVLLKPSSFAKFSYYSGIEAFGVVWTRGDTIWGPLHTQDYLRTNLDPVFYGKVTTNQGLASNGNSKGKFYGGFDQGVSLGFPSNIQNLFEQNAIADGYKFSGADTVIIKLKSDSLSYRFSHSQPDTTVLISDFAPNGVIFANSATVRLSGIISSKISIGAGGNLPKGNLYIDDDLIYQNGTSGQTETSEMAGLFASNDIIVSDNYNNTSDVNIHGVLFSENGGLTAENYTTRPVSGSVRVWGGIIQQEGKMVGKFSGNALVAGFKRKFTYDNRLMKISPPGFPITGSLEIVSWYE